MNTAVITLLQTVLPLAVKWGIPAARDIISLVYKENPTLEDWHSALDKAEENAQKFLKLTEPHA